METNDNALTKKGCISCGLEFEPGFTICPDCGTQLTTLGSEDALIGTILADRYEIMEVIGGGGMGLVYKARHKLMNRIVAIKMLHKHMISSADTLKRFQLEAQAASCLSLPNILAVYDFGLTNEGQPYMVMDYLEGISLADVIEEEDHVAVDRAVDIFIQACTGLAHAHQKGVLHRDIKPSNIMLVHFDNQDDFVKIVDFGIAKLLNQGSTGELTKTGEVYGSPSYMSPEQCRGKETDARSDIYALGCVMYRCLTGHPLFSGDDIIELLFKQVSEAPATFDVLCPEYEIPTELEDIVFKALAKSPIDRYQNMDQFKEALEYFRESRHLKPTDAPRPLWKRPETAPRARGAAAAASLPSAPAPVSEPPRKAPTVEQPQRREEPTQRPPQVASPVGGGPQPEYANNRTAANSATRNTAPSESMIRRASEGDNRSALRRKIKQSDNKALIIAIVAVGVTALGAVAFVWHASTSGGGPVNVAEDQPEPRADTTTTVSTDSTATTDNGDPIADGKAALKASDYAKAKTQFENGLAANEKKFGKESPEAAEAMSLLSSALVGLKDYKGAESNAKAALTIKEAKRGATSQDLVPDLVVLASSYQQQKQYDQAEKMMLRAISIQETVGGKNDLNAGTYDFQLAQIYHEAGKNQDANNLAKKALGIKEASLGSDNPQLTQIRTFIASVAAPAHAAPVQPTEAAQPTQPTPTTKPATEPPATQPEPPVTPVHTAAKPDHPAEHHHKAPSHHESHAKAHHDAPAVQEPPAVSTHASGAYASWLRSHPQGH